jgi:hypothetical protein
MKPRTFGRFIEFQWNSVAVKWVASKAQPWDHIRHFIIKPKGVVASALENSMFGVDRFVGRAHYNTSRNPGWG